MASDASSLHDLPGDVALQGTSSQYIRPENDEGAVEYKLKLYRTRGPRFEQLVTQLRFRLSEGNGVAWYYLGVMDNGHLLGLPPDELAATFASLQAMARAVHAQCRVERVLAGQQGQCLCAKVWLNATERVDFQDVRVAVAGSMDTGKSTLIAVLTQGTYGLPELDNGHGGARTSVFRHKHELESGRTSSLARATLGYGSRGQVLNYQGCKPLTQREIALAAATVVNFVDLGGHPRYLKTALFGLTCMAPHYMLLCCSVRDGLGTVGATHLAAALALELPLIVVLTKVDGVDQASLEEAQEAMQALLEQAIGAAPPDPPPVTLLPVTTTQQAHAAAAQLNAPRSTTASRLVVPVLSVSSVDGTGLPALHALLAALQGSHAASTALAEEDTLIYVDREFLVQGVGRVMAGTVLAGGVSLGQKLALVGGGGVGLVCVSSIHRSHVSVEVLGPDQSATLAIAAAPVETTEPSGTLLTDTLVDGNDTLPTHTASPPSAVDRDDPFAGLMTDGFDHEEPVEGPVDFDLSGHLAEAEDLHPMSDGGYASSLLGSSPEADWAGVASAPTRMARHRRCGQGPRSGWAPLRTRSESHMLRMRSCTSAHAGGVPQQRGSNNGGHRGAVLLGLSRPTQLRWRLQCLLVLWSGVWPPRGLLSGCWPPQGVSSSKDSSDSGDSPDGVRTALRRQRPSALAPGEAPAQLLALHRQLLHAGQVRAEARVVAMQEIMDVDLKGPAGRTTLVDWQDVTPLLRAARALAASAPDGDALAVVAQVSFEFVNAPQWVAPSTRVLVHDRNAGVLAAVGVVLDKPDIV